MARLRLGDRVANRKHPNDCGTIVAILDNGPGDVHYRIHWDNESSTLLSDSLLVPCSSSLPRLGQPRTD